MHQIDYETDAGKLGAHEQFIVTLVYQDMFYVKWHMMAFYLAWLNQVGNKERIKTLSLHIFKLKIEYLDHDDIVNMLQQINQQDLQPSYP